MDMDRIEDQDYFKKIILGGRQYCLKEPLSTLPKARMQLKAYVFSFNFAGSILKLFLSRLYVLDRVTKVVLVTFLGWTLIKWFGLNDMLSSQLEQS